MNPHDGVVVLQPPARWATPFQGNATFAFAMVGTFTASTFQESLADVPVRRLKTPGFAVMDFS